MHWIGKNTVFNEHLVDTITIHASISSPAEEMPDEETSDPIMRVLLFKKVNFVPVFPKLVPIGNNIVSKVQEYVPFWLKLVPVGKKLFLNKWNVLHLVLTLCWNTVPN